MGTLEASGYKNCKASFGLSDQYVPKDDVELVAQSLDDSKSRKKRNKMSFTMKKIPDSALNKLNESQDNYKKRLSSFSCRADVIYK